MLHVALCQTGPGSSGGMTTVELFHALWACRGSFQGAMVVNGGATSLLYNPATPALRRDLQYNHLVRPQSSACSCRFQPSELQFWGLPGYLSACS